MYTPRIVLMKSTHCIQAMMCATKGGATARSQDNQGYTEAGNDACAGKPETCWPLLGRTIIHCRMHPVRTLYRDSEELFQSGREGVIRCDDLKHTALTRRHLEAVVCRQTAAVVDESLLEAGVDATAFFYHTATVNSVTSLHPNQRYRDGI